MAQIIKIIETTLETGATTLTVTDAAIPYSIIAVNCDKYGTYPADMTVSGTSLTLTYEAQTEDLHLAISLIKSNLAVIDDLTSESQTDALSAAQGKALKTLIDNIVVTGTLADLDDVDLTNLTAGDILVYDAVNQKWVNSKTLNCDIITNTSGQFNTITGGLLQSCVIDLIPVQSGSGTPSPENVRPITGHSSVEVDVTDADSNTTQYTIALGQTVYGGSLDVVSGVLTVTHAFNVFDGSSDENWTINGTGSGQYPFANIAVSDNNTTTSIISNEFAATTIYTSNQNIGVYKSTTNLRVRPDFALTDATAWKTWLSSNPLQVCYPLAAPLTIQLTPTQINTLIGENHLDIPLEGQSLDSLSYREMMAWPDVKKVATASGDSGFNYSTTEHIIGTWIDGSDLYERTINAGTLPNNSTKNVETLTNIADVIDIEGFVYDNEGYFRPLPFAADSSNTIRVDVNDNVLRITTYTDWSGYVGSYITIRYTKTS